MSEFSLETWLQRWEAHICFAGTSGSADTRIGNLLTLIHSHSEKKLVPLPPEIAPLIDHSDAGGGLRLRKQSSVRRRLSLKGAEGLGPVKGTNFRERENETVGGYRKLLWAVTLGLEQLQVLSFLNVDS